MSGCQAEGVVDRHYNYRCDIVPKRFTPTWFSRHFSVNSLKWHAGNKHHFNTSRYYADFLHFKSDSGRRITTGAYLPNHLCSVFYLYGHRILWFYHSSSFYQFLRFFQYLILAPPYSILDCFIFFGGYEPLMLLKTPVYKYGVPAGIKYI